MDIGFLSTTVEPNFEKEGDGKRDRQVKRKQRRKVQG
jgi:hypothetical protein